MRHRGGVTPPLLLLSADSYFDLAGEEFGRRLLLTTNATGAEHCLRPDFTLPIVEAYIADGVGKPAAFSYLGPIFRQRETGAAEFDQAGIELLVKPDGEVALDQALTFARCAFHLWRGPQYAPGWRWPVRGAAGTGRHAGRLAAAHP
ncbi:MAG: hypothetical protein MO846_00900 [Candidatus Devosia symbiotica]|nr:hypothetical protein [Candidatus Devosia symbiotica]